jgi:hypothetical protein
MKKAIGIISLCALCAIVCSSPLPQGTKAGWPTAELKNWGFPDLKQPDGVKSSYTEESTENISSLTVYMTGANAKTLQELKQYIEKKIGMKINTDQPIMLWNGIGLQYLKLEGNLLEMKLEYAD